MDRDLDFWKQCYRGRGGEGSFVAATAGLGSEVRRPHLIRLTGELQMATVAIARRSIWAGMEPAQPLIVDLGGISFLDSAGLGLLLSVHREVTRRGGCWAIVGASEPVARLLKVTRADRLLPLFATPADAERSWSERESA